MRITALAGGVGGARFLRGLRRHLDARDDGPHELTVIGNTGDDITLFGLRVCPDIDTLLYTLGGGVHEGQGWGRDEDTYRVQDDLLAYGAVPDWFRLGDLDLAIAIRTAVVKDGTLYVQAAAGVVADSVPESEWQETENKARAVLRAAELVQAGLDGQI